MRLPACSPVLLAAAALLSAACNSTETGTSGDTTTTTTTASGGSGGAGGATGGSGGSTATGGAGGSGGAAVIGGDRPVKMHVSSKYDAAKPAPLLILLHGYGASGTVQEDLYFKLKAQADARGYVYGVADGTVDAGGKRFWNATDACCNFGGSTVDDSAYLSGVVDQIKAAYNIDPKRVYFVGHSNGGFMSYRMACDHADQIAAIVSLAGATFKDDSKCKPSEPVAVAQIHGDMDETIAYAGGDFGGVVFYPGAAETVSAWAAHDGCDGTATDGPAKDLDTGLAGAETTTKVFATGCKPGGHVELWTIAGGKHVPAVSDEFRADVFDFLDAHPKP